MNLAQTKLVLGTLYAAFPAFYKDMKPQATNGISKLWQEMFADDPYELVAAAVKALIATKVEGYPPTIGAVKEQIVKLTVSKGITEQQAWALVSKACENGYYNYQKEYDKLPPEVQRAVGRPEQLKEWSTMPVDTVQSVVASNFMRSFRASQTRQKELAMMPEDVKSILKLTMGGEENHGTRQLDGGGLKRLGPTQPPPMIPPDRDETVKKAAEALSAKAPPKSTYKPPSEEEFEKMREDAIMRFRAAMDKKGEETK